VVPKGGRCPRLRNPGLDKSWEMHLFKMSICYR